jgi:uncharacterized protein YdhG (YjbR/CyaY superfamily)
MAKPPSNIDEYLKGVSPIQRAALEKLRKQILALVPDATECISYSMPAFRTQGHVVAGFLATTKGCSYFPFSGTTLDSMATALTAYSRTKSGLHFAPERGLPATLLRKLLKTRLAELAPVAPAKKQPTSKKAASKAPRAKKSATARPRSKKVLARKR